MDPTDVEFDAFCDPNNPRKIKYDDILRARETIAGAVIRTNCPKCYLSEMLGVELYLKQEFLQYTGSFKERGVRNTLMNLTDDQKKVGVMTASYGNHGMALSHHSKKMGIPCIVVVPAYCPAGKVSKITRYGAKVILHGLNFAECKHHAMSCAKQKNMTYVNGSDHPNVIEGQGTIGLEILDQVPDVEAVLLPCGGGSLLAGCGTVIKHLNPEIEVYGIETDKTQSMTLSLKNKERTFLKIEYTIVDGLAVNLVGVNTFHSVQGIVDKMIVVSEDWVTRAVTAIFENERYIVEGAGSVGIAAIMAGLLPNLKGKKVVCVCTGGNIVPSILNRILERGLSGMGRLFRFRVVINDQPGSLAELMSVLASISITPRDVVSEKMWLKGDVTRVEFKVLAESKGWDHTKEMIMAIKNNFDEYYFTDMTAKPCSENQYHRELCLAPNPICMKKKYADDSEQ